MNEFRQPRFMEQREWGRGPCDWLKLLQTSAPAEGEVKGGR